MAGYYERKKTIATCGECALPFVVSPAALRRGAGKFCSMQCRDSQKRRLVINEAAGTKKCGRCHCWKPFSDFNRVGEAQKASRRFPLQAYCKTCSAVAYRENSQRPERRVARREQALTSYWNNPEKARAAARTMSDERRARKNAAARAYRKINKDRVREWNRARNARVRALGKVTGSDIAKIIVKQGGTCVGCLCTLPAKGFHLDHVVPISKGGTSDVGNLQVLCATCNLKKARRDNDEFMRSMGRLA